MNIRKSNSPFVFSRTTSKGNQVLDLEKYFKQQAALAEQKRKLRKSSKEKDDVVPNKKQKLSSTDTETHKRSHKSRSVKSTKDNCIQDTSDTDTSNVRNETLNNSSGSEYVPSDNEIESGNTLVILIHDAFV